MVFLPLVVIRALHFNYITTNDVQFATVCGSPMHNLASCLQYQLNFPKQILKILYICSQISRIYTVQYFPCMLFLYTVFKADTSSINLSSMHIRLEIYNSPFCTSDICSLNLFYVTEVLACSCYYFRYNEVVHRRVLFLYYV